MKPIYLDIGNTNAKVTEYTGSEWRVLFSDSIRQVEALVEIFQTQFSTRKVIASSVRRDITKQLKQRLPDFRFREIRFSDIPAMQLNYNTPQTLGMDRFLTCLGAVSQTNQSAVVIDAGSACTVDFMTADFVFQGGVIFPGLKVLKRTFNEELPELPVPKPEIPDEWPGRSTEDSIRWGLYGGYKAALQKFIDKYRENNPELTIYLTGGSAADVQLLFEAEVEFSVNPFLLFEGMKVASERWL